MDSKRSKNGFSFNSLNKRDIAGATVIILINVCISWLLFGNMLLQLNSVSFAKSGDGLKGYYTSSYHIKFDKSYNHTEGMNYPFGEHIFFTDSQPLVTNTIKWISHNITDISNYSTGIINTLMLLSIIIGSLIIYLIFRKLGVSMLVSILAASSIVWLSPQLARMGGHFALSYITHIPGLIFLVILFAEKPLFIRSLWIMLWGLILALTHLYFYGIVAIMIIVFWIWAARMIPANIISNGRKLLHFVIQAIIPILLVQLYLGFTDSVADRPGSPWGFMHYRAYPESVFLPLQLPHGEWLAARLGFNHSYIDWEGHAYAGAAASILFAVIFFRMLYHLITLRFSCLSNLFRNPFLSMIFWAGFLALLYSFAVPFVFNLEWLLKYLGPIRQMRGVARFAWLFFYVMNIIVIVMAYRKLKQKPSLLWYALLVLIIIANSTEAYYNSRSLKNFIDNPDQLSATHRYVPEPKNYQAIVPLPYFHVGSENISWTDDAGLLPEAFRLSLCNGIPITGVYLSRTSLEQTYLQISPFLTGENPPAVFKLYDCRNILLLTADDFPLNETEMQLIAESSDILHCEGFRVGSIPFRSYKRIIEQNRGMSTNDERFQKFGDITIPDIRRYSRVIEAEIPEGAVKGWLFFAVPGFRKDLIPRTTANIVIQENPQSNLLDDWKPIAHSLTGFLSDNTSIHLITFDIPANAKMLHFNTQNKGLKKQLFTYKDIRIAYTFREEP